MNKTPIGNKKVIGTILILTLLLFATFTVAVKAANPTPVPLGWAATFAVLAGAGITNTGPTTITGDVGTFPTTTETGFGSVTLLGTNHNGDGVTQAAKLDLTTAYVDAAGRTPVSTIGTELGGSTLTPGVYNSAAGTFGITGTLTLDGQGNSSSVFIFKAGSTLTTASGSSVVLINGAQAGNVFWQVGSSASIGTNSIFVGNILALLSITVTTGATVDGRLLARNGAVTLDSNTITIPLEGIVLAPVSATNPVSTLHTVTATVTESGGVPVVGRSVTFNVVSGPNAGLTSAVLTDVNGQASFTFTSSSPGTDTITASFMDTQGTTVTSNQVTKIWTGGSPTPTPTATPSPTPTPSASPTPTPTGGSPTPTPTATPSPTPTASPSPTPTEGSNGHVPVGGEILPLNILSVLLSQYSAVIVLLIVLSVLAVAAVMMRRKK